MACVQKLQVLQILSQLQKPVYNKLSECKIINLKLLFVNRLILTASKTACFNKTGNNRILKNKQEITKTIISYLNYTIYNANKYQYYLSSFDFLKLTSMFVLLLSNFLG